MNCFFELKRLGIVDIENLDSGAIETNQEFEDNPNYILEASEFSRCYQKMARMH